MNAIISALTALVVNINFLSFFPPEARLIMTNTHKIEAAAQIFSEKLYTLSTKVKRKKEKDITAFLPKEKASLEIWLYEKNDDDLDWPIQVFEKNIDNVTIEVKSFAEKESYLHQVDYALTHDDAPDLIILPDKWLADREKYFFAAPEELFNLAECQDFFFRFACHTFADEEKNMLALPIFVRSTIMFVNTDLLRDDRITVGDRPERDWISFNKNKNNFYQFASKKESFVGLSSKRPADLLLFFKALKVQAGEGDNSEEIAKFMNNFFDDYSRKDNSMERFLEGKVAILFGDQTTRKEILQAFLTKNKDLEIRKEAIVLQVIPRIKDQTLKTSGEAWGLMVPKKANNKNLAWAFLAFLAEEDKLADLSKKMQETAARQKLAPFDIFNKVANYTEVLSSPYAQAEFEEIFMENIILYIEEKDEEDKALALENIISFLESNGQN